MMERKNKPNVLSDDCKNVMRSEEEAACCSGSADVQCSSMGNTSSLTDNVMEEASQKSLPSSVDGDVASMKPHTSDLVDEGKKRKTFLEEFSNDYSIEPTPSDKNVEIKDWFRKSIFVNEPCEDTRINYGIHLICDTTSEPPTEKDIHSKHNFCSMKIFNNCNNCDDYNMDFVSKEVKVSLNLFSGSSFGNLDDKMEDFDCGNSSLQRLPRFQRQNGNKVVYHLNGITTHSPEDVENSFFEQHLCQLNNNNINAREPNSNNNSKISKSNIIFPDSYKISTANRLPHYVKATLSTVSSTKNTHLHKAVFTNDLDIQSSLNITYPMSSADCPATRTTSGDLPDDQSCEDPRVCNRHQQQDSLHQKSAKFCICQSDCNCCHKTYTTRSDKNSLSTTESQVLLKSTFLPRRTSEDFWKMYERHIRCHRREVPIKASQTVNDLSKTQSKLCEVVVEVSDASLSTGTVPQTPDNSLLADQSLDNPKMYSRPKNKTKVMQTLQENISAIADIIAESKEGNFDLLTFVNEKLKEKEYKVDQEWNDEVSIYEVQSFDISSKDVLVVKQPTNLVFSDKQCSNYFCLLGNTSNNDTIDKGNNPNDDTIFLEMENQLDKAMDLSKNDDDAFEVVLDKIGSSETKTEVLIHSGTEQMEEKNASFDDTKYKSADAGDVLKVKLDNEIIVEAGSKHLENKMSKEKILNVVVGVDLSGDPTATAMGNENQLVDVSEQETAKIQSDILSNAKSSVEKVDIVPNISQKIAGTETVKLNEKAENVLIEEVHSDKATKTGTSVDIEASDTAAMLGEATRQNTNTGVECVVDDLENVEMTVMDSEVVAKTDASAEMKEILSASGNMFGNLDSNEELAVAQQIEDKHLIKVDIAKLSTSNDVLAKKSSEKILSTSDETAVGVMLNVEKADSEIEMKSNIHVVLDDVKKSNENLIEIPNDGCNDPFVDVSANIASETEKEILLEIKNKSPSTTNRNESTSPGVEVLNENDKENNHMIAEAIAIDESKKSLSLIDNGPKLESSAGVELIRETVKIDKLLHNDQHIVADITVLSDEESKSISNKIVESPIEKQNDLETYDNIDSVPTGTGKENTANKSSLINQITDSKHEDEDKIGVGVETNMDTFLKIDGKDQLIDDAFATGIVNEKVSNDEVQKDVGKTSSLKLSLANKEYSTTAGIDLVNENNDKNKVISKGEEVAEQNGLIVHDTTMQSKKIDSKDEIDSVNVGFSLTSAKNANLESNNAINGVQHLVNNEKIEVDINQTSILLKNNEQSVVNLENQHESCETSIGTSNNAVAHGCQISKKIGTRTKGNDAQKSDNSSRKGSHLSVAQNINTLIAEHETAVDLNLDNVVRKRKEKSLAKSTKQMSTGENVKELSDSKVVAVVDVFTQKNNLEGSQKVHLTYCPTATIMKHFLKNDKPESDLKMSESNSVVDDKMLQKENFENMELLQNSSNLKESIGEKICAKSETDFSKSDLIDDAAYETDYADSDDEASIVTLSDKVKRKVKCKKKARSNHFNKDASLDELPKCTVAKINSKNDLDGSGVTKENTKNIKNNSGSYSEDVNDVVVASTERVLDFPNTKEKIIATNGVTKQSCTSVLPQHQIVQENQDQISANDLLQPAFHGQPNPHHENQSDQQVHVVFSEIYEYLESYIDQFQPRCFNLEEAARILCDEQLKFVKKASSDNLQIQEELSSQIRKNANQFITFLHKKSVTVTNKILKACLEVKDVFKSTDASQLNDTRYLSQVKTYYEDFIDKLINQTEMQVTAAANQSDLVMKRIQTQLSTHRVNNTEDSSTLREIDNSILSMAQHAQNSDSSEHQMSKVENALLVEDLANTHTSNQQECEKMGTYSSEIVLKDSRQRASLGSTREFYNNSSCDDLSSKNVVDDNTIASTSSNNFDDSSISKQDKPLHNHLTQSVVQGTPLMRGGESISPDKMSTSRVKRGVLTPKYYQKLTGKTSKKNDVNSRILDYWFKDKYDVVVEDYQDSDSTKQSVESKGHYSRLSPNSPGSTVSATKKSSVLGTERLVASKNSLGTPKGRFQIPNFKDIQQVESKRDLEAKQYIDLPKLSIANMEKYKHRKKKTLVKSVGSKISSDRSQWTISKGSSNDLKLSAASTSDVDSQGSSPLSKISIANLSDIDSTIARTNSPKNTSDVNKEDYQLDSTYNELKNTTDKTDIRQTESTESKQSSDRRYQRKSIANRKSKKAFAVDETSNMSSPQMEQKIGHFGKYPIGMNMYSVAQNSEVETEEDTNVDSVITDMGKIREIAEDFNEKQAIDTTTTIDTSVDIVTEDDHDHDNVTEDDHDVMKEDQQQVVEITTSQDIVINNTTEDMQQQVDTTMDVSQDNIVVDNVTEVEHEFIEHLEDKSQKFDIRKSEHSSDAKNEVVATIPKEDDSTAVINHKNIVNDTVVGVKKMVYNLPDGTTREVNIQQRMSQFASTISNKGSLSSDDGDQSQEVDINLTTNLTRQNELGASTFTSLSQFKMKFTPEEMKQFKKNKQLPVKAVNFLGNIRIKDAETAPQ